jgi:hypothetical protein
LHLQSPPNIANNSSNQVQQSRSTIGYLEALQHPKLPRVDNSDTTYACISKHNLTPPHFIHYNHAPYYTIEYKHLHQSMSISFRHTACNKPNQLQYHNTQTYSWFYILSFLYIIFLCDTFVNPSSKYYLLIQTSPQHIIATQNPTSNITIHYTQLTLLFTCNKLGIVHTPTSQTSFHPSHEHILLSEFLPYKSTFQRNCPYQLHSRNPMSNSPHIQPNVPPNSRQINNPLHSKLDLAYSMESLLTQSSVEPSFCDNSYSLLSHISNRKHLRSSSITNLTLNLQK